MAIGDFQRRHKLITVYGTAFASETWSFGLRVDPGTDTNLVDQAQADALKAPVLTWWNDVNNGFSQYHILQGVKLAPIGINGKYPAGEVAYIGDITDTAGALNTNVHPAQCSMVMTLVSATTPRGKGSLGRVYLPAPCLSISSAGNVGGYPPTAVVAFRTLLNAINAIVNLGTVSIFSRETSHGIAQQTPVGFCRMDNIMDTQRRRRRNIVGTRSTSAAVVL